MRHVTAERLGRIGPLLEQLRGIDGLNEPKLGTFYRKRNAFLHFHEHGDDLFADVKLDGVQFERVRVTTKTEQRALVASVRRALR